LPSRRGIERGKTFASGRIRKPIIQCHDLKRRGPLLRSQKRRCQLQGVGGSQGVDAKETGRRFADSLAWFDLMPGG